MELIGMKLKYWAETWLSEVILYDRLSFAISTLSFCKNSIIRPTDFFVLQHFSASKKQKLCAIVASTPL